VREKKSRARHALGIRPFVREDEVASGASHGAMPAQGGDDGEARAVCLVGGKLKRDEDDEEAEIMETGACKI
jgi:hypothetical protein